MGLTSYPICPTCGLYERVLLWGYGGGYGGLYRNVGNTYLEVYFMNKRRLRRTLESYAANGLRLAVYQASILRASPKPIKAPYRPRTAPIKPIVEVLPPTRYEDTSYIDRIKASLARTAI